MSVELSPRAGVSIRGYRPGRYGLPSLEEVETERLLKLAKIMWYAQRVGAGLPVFEEDETPRRPLQGDAAGEGG